MYVVKQLEQRVCWSMKIIQLMFLSRQNSLCLFIRLICLFIIQSFLAKSQFLKKYTIIKCNYTFFDCSHFAMKLQLNTATLTLILYLSSDFRGAYAVNIAECQVPHSFRTVCGFFCVPPTTELIMKTCETGPTVYRPYPRRLESLNICGCPYKFSLCLFVCLFFAFVSDRFSSQPTVLFFFFPFICLFRTVSLSGRLAGIFFVVLLVF